MNGRRHAWRCSAAQITEQLDRLARLRGQNERARQLGIGAARELMFGVLRAAIVGKLERLVDDHIEQFGFGLP